MNDAVEIIKSGPFDKLVDIAHKFAGPAADELGLLMADKIKLWRLKNWVDVVKKADKILREANLGPNAVPPRMFIPILEASSIENNETLQDLWAGLLASASEEADSLSPSFIETLKQLTPGQAVALEGLYDFSQFETESANRMRDLSRWISLSSNPDASQLAVENFERLGIIRRNYNLQSEYQFFLQSNGLDHSNLDHSTAFVSEPMDVDSMPHLSYRLGFTEFGIRFMQACRGPRKNADESDPA